MSPKLTARDLIRKLVRLLLRDELRDAGGVCRQINPDQRLLVGNALETYKSPTFFNDIPNGLNHGSAKGHRA